METFLKFKRGISMVVGIMSNGLPCASATTSVDAPYSGGKLRPTDTVPRDSRFTVLVKPDETVEAAHVNINNLSVRTKS